MTGKKSAIAPDFQKRLERIDAHVIRPEEYEDAPELTDEQLAAADIHEGGKLVRRGRPPSPTTRKKAIKLRIDPSVLAAWRASGAGWQTRMTKTLARAAPRSSASGRVKKPGAAAKKSRA